MGLKLAVLHVDEHGRVSIGFEPIEMIDFVLEFVRRLIGQCCEEDHVFHGEFFELPIARFHAIGVSIDHETVVAVQRRVVRVLAAPFDLLVVVVEHRRGQRQAGEGDQRQNEEDQVVGIDVQRNGMMAFDPFDQARNE